MSYFGATQLRLKPMQETEQH